MICIIRRYRSDTSMMGEVVDPTKYEFHLSVMAIFKNETMNLNVWLDHYLWQGVEHFFLIDNGSTDDPLDILQSYIDRGIVTYRLCPERHQQVDQYNRICEEERVRDRTEWLCVCDLDEFFYGTHTTLRATLQSMEADVDVVYSAWKMFGHDNLVAHPPDIRTAIVHRNPELELQHTKYICKTSVLTLPDMLWIHYVRVPPHVCGSHRTPMQFYEVKSIDLIHSLHERRFYEVKSIDLIHSKNLREYGPVLCHENDRIQLNHYPIQSLQFYQQVKMTRGAADDANHEHVRDMKYFHERVANCVYVDDELARLVRDGYPNDRRDSF